MSIPLGPLGPVPTVQQRMQQAQTAFDQFQKSNRGDGFNDSQEQKSLNLLGSVVCSQQRVLDVFVRKHPELLNEIAG